MDNKPIEGEITVNCWGDLRKVKVRYWPTFGSLQVKWIDCLYQGENWRFVDLQFQRRQIMDSPNFKKLIENNKL
jgi:hypothetical protein